MVLTEQELDWLQLAIEDNNKYHISVDNDCISIDECVDEENDEWDSVFVFNNYGQDLIVQLFNYIGCKEMVLDEILSGYTLSYRAVHGSDDRIPGIE